MKQRIDWKPFIHPVKSVFHDDPGIEMPRSFCCIMGASFFVACIAGLFHATLIQVAQTAIAFLEFVLSNYIYSIRTF